MLFSMIGMVPKVIISHNLKVSYPRPGGAKAKRDAADRRRYSLRDNMVTLRESADSCQNIKAISKKSKVKRNQ